MKEIQSTTIEVKLSDGHEDKYCLVHDGKRVIAIVEPGAKTGTHPSRTMLVGTKEDLEAIVKEMV